MLLTTVPSRFKLYHAPWSKASDDVTETFKTFGEQFMPNTVMEISELENEPEEHRRAAIRVYPTLVKYVDGVEVARRTKDLDLVGLVEFMKE